MTDRPISARALVLTLVLCVLVVAAAVWARTAMPAHAPVPVVTDSERVRDYPEASRRQFDPDTIVLVGARTPVRNDLARELNAGKWRTPRGNELGVWDRADNGRKTMRVTRKCAVSIIPRHSLAVCAYGTS